MLHHLDSYSVLKVNLPTLGVIVCYDQKPILNFAPRGKLWPQERSCPPGVSFAPWGWSYPLGVKLSPGSEILFCPSILLNSRECSPLGVNEGGNIPPGDKFHTWGPGVKLRMALRVTRLGQFSHIGRLFSSGRFLDNDRSRPNFLTACSTVKVMLLIWTKIWLGYLFRRCLLVHTHLVTLIN
jgi:hypothetical protein